MDNKLGIFLGLMGLSMAVPAQQLPYFHEVAGAAGIDSVSHVTEIYGNGAAACDFDLDGDVDFYLCTGRTIPDRLYQNDGSGHFTDIAVESGIVETGSSRAALWLDYNGDSLPDIFVAAEKCVNRNCISPIQLALYKQLPDHTFTEVTVEAGLVLGTEFDLIQVMAVGGIAAADINQDQFLDIVLAVWGGGMKLFLNNGDGTFSDATEGSGLTMGEDPTPWQPMFLDVNGDGWLDLYTNVDFAANKLWINQGGVFEDQAESYGLANAFNEMGMAITDYDNDGDLDLYVTNITREFQGVQQANLLYKQELLDGRVHFRDVAGSVGVSQSGWDWGTTFLDIDNDGRQDLATTNGWDPLLWNPDPSYLWLNTLAGFVDVSEQCGINDELPATTLLAFDKDNDGDLDLLQTLKTISYPQMPLRLYENDGESNPGQGNSLRILPRMAGPNHFAIGSEVTLVADGLVSTRLISAGSSFYGQEPAEAFFGLGDRDSIDEVIVRWPDGQVSVYQGMAVNSSHTLPRIVVAPPTDLQIMAENEGITLTWTDNSDNEAGFVLMVSEHPAFSDSDRITLEAGATSFQENRRDPSRTWYYRLRAFNELVFSDNSNLVILPGENVSQEWINPVLVAPNPVEDQVLAVRSQIPFEGTAEFRLLSVQGARLWEQEVQGVQAFEEFRFSLGLPAGMYFLQVRMGESEQTEKVLVN